MSTAVAKREAVQEVVETIDRPEFQAQLAEMIPPDLALETFVRHTKLALQLNPELLGAERGSLFLAMVKGAASGLLPDGRESAFVIVKQKGIEKVQFWPMVGGLRKIAAKHGITLAASVIYANDQFSYTKMPPSVTHAPTPLGQERGEPLGAWAAALDSTGRMICPPVVMDVAEIEKVRATSKTGGSEYSPWKNWWDRMACKTVARRLFAEMPLADSARADIERALNADIDRGEVEEATAAVPALANLPQVDIEFVEAELAELAEESETGDSGGVPSFAADSPPESSSADSFTELARQKGLVGEQTEIGE